MIAELGHAALWLAAALAGLQLVSGALALRAGSDGPSPIALYARPAAVVQAVLALLAFVSLALAVTNLLPLPLRQAVPHVPV